MERYTDIAHNIHIQAKQIQIGTNVSFGKDTRIDVRGILRIGDRTHLGDHAQIEGRNISIGSDCYFSSRKFGGLQIGLGRKNWPDANFTLGNRCTLHNNIVDLIKPVTIGNDVGLSPEVTIFNHGYWLSVLEGFPAKHASVKINDGVIVGYRSLVLMGVHIGPQAVIGAQSVVTSDLEGNAIYGGNPAREIKKIVPLNLDQKIERLGSILQEYERVAKYRGLKQQIRLEYPYILVNDCQFNVESMTCLGRGTLETDDFRDFVFRYGLRFYTDRPFKNIFLSDE